MLSQYYPYVKFFEDNLEGLAKSLLAMNYVKKEPWADRCTVQALFLSHIPRTLFSAFQQIMNGDYYEGCATCRIAYETILRIMFIAKYPDNYLSTFAPQKGARRFVASNFLSNDLKVTDEDPFYAFLSFPVHSHKQHVLSALGKGEKGIGIVLDFNYEFSERDLSIAFNNLLCILYFSIRLFSVLFNKYLEGSDNDMKHPVALETYIKAMPNKFAGLPDLVEKTICKFEKSHLNNSL